MIFDLVKETNLNLGTDFKRPKELWDYARIASDRLRKQWLDSNRTDYSIYKDPEYVYEGLICFSAVSQPSITNLERYTRVVGLPKGNLLDIYNGIGLTSIYAALVGFTPTAVNDNPAQVDFMQKSALRHLGYEIPVIESLSEVPTASFDYVVSLEVLEHFTEPLKHLDETLSKVRAPNGIFVESTGFVDCNLPGHFEFYRIDAEVISHRQMSKPIKVALNKNFFEEASCVNRKPRIWRMKGEQTETVLWSHKKNGQKGRFRCLVRDMERFGLEPHFLKDK